MMKRILGFLILIAGIGALLVSNYIMEQVDEGKEKISDAETQVERGNRLFSMNPVAEEVGKGLTSGATKKINAGKEEVARYEMIAHNLKTAGFVAIGFGVLLVLLSLGKKPQRR
jgi:hypothetical protein